MWRVYCFLGCVVLFRLVEVCFVFVGVCFDVSYMWGLFVVRFVMVLLVNGIFFGLVGLVCGLEFVFLV